MVNANQHTGTAPRRLPLTPHGVRVRSRVNTLEAKRLVLLTDILILCDMLEVYDEPIQEL